MSRRTRLAPLAAALAVLLALAGCSTPPTSGSTTPTTTAESGAFPVSVATKFGAVQVKSQPKRVVALGWGDAETALALGVQPVGASDWLGFGGEGVGPWAKGLYSTAPTIIRTLEPSYEKIASLQPDLILDTKGSGDAGRYERLSEIAPTIAVPKGGDSYLTTPEQQMTMVSTALGLADRGEQLLKRVDDAFAAAAKAHPEWKGRTVSAATKTSEGWGAYVDGTERVQFFQRLGFEQNPRIAALKADASGFSVSLSSEQLDRLDADLVVAFPIFITTSALTGDALWKAIPAVKSGRDIVIDGDLSSAYSLGTTLATTYALERLVPRIAAATAS